MGTARACLGCLGTAGALHGILKCRPGQTVHLSAACLLVPAWGLPGSAGPVTEHSQKNGVNKNGFIKTACFERDVHIPTPFVVVVVVVVANISKMII